MISAKTSSATDDVTVVFLDANILAKPVTRTILMVGGMPSGFQPVWSLAAETEAARHMRPRALSPALVRERFGLPLTPTGHNAERYVGTRTADRQILADAVEAGARFLITEDVDDFGIDDLVSVGISRLVRSAAIRSQGLALRFSSTPMPVPARSCEVGTTGHAGQRRRPPRQSGLRNRPVGARTAVGSHSPGTRTYVRIRWLDAAIVTRVC